MNKNPLDSIDPLGLSAADVLRIKELFNKTVNNMTDEGLRLDSGKTGNTIRNLDIFNPFSQVRTTKIMDCGEQTEYMNEKLKNNSKNFDDNWNFIEVSGLSHAWGIAVSSNQQDPIIWYDTRANDISEGKPCNNCKGLIGGYLDSWSNTEGFWNDNSNNHPNKILQSYYPPNKKGKK